MKDKQYLIPLDETIKSSIGARVKLWRTKNGFSSKELASKLNISNSTMSKIETGMQTITSQQLLDGAKLGWDAHWLLTGELSRECKIYDELEKVLAKFSTEQKESILQMLQLLSK